MNGPVTTVELASLRSIWLSLTKKNIPLEAEEPPEASPTVLWRLGEMKYIFDYPVPFLIIGTAIEMTHIFL